MSATLVCGWPRFYLVPHWAPRRRDGNTEMPNLGAQTSTGYSFSKRWTTSHVPVFLCQHASQAMSLPNVMKEASRSRATVQRTSRTSALGPCPLYELGRVIEQIFSQTLSLFGLVSAITPSITLPPLRPRMDPQLHEYGRLINGLFGYRLVPPEEFIRC